MLPRAATSTSGDIHPAASEAQQERGDIQHYCFDVKLLSGRSVYKYHGPDLNIERLLQDFDEGLIEGVPKARTKEDGRQLEAYSLYWDTIQLRDGQWLNDYLNSPSEAIFTLVLHSLPR